MAEIRGIMIIINFIVIMKLVAAHPLLNTKSIESTVNRLSKLELNHKRKPENILELNNEIYLKFDTNELDPEALDDLSIPNEQNIIIKGKHTSKISDQVLSKFSEIFIRDSVEVFQNKLKNTRTPHIEFSDILAKITNISREDMRLVGKALYNAMELMNDVNADYEISQNTTAWLEIVLDCFKQFMKKVQLVTSPNDVYGNISMVDDIEKNFEAVMFFWLNF